MICLISALATRGQDQLWRRPVKAMGAEFERRPRCKYRQRWASVAVRGEHAGESEYKGSPQIRSLLRTFGAVFPGTFQPRKFDVSLEGLAEALHVPVGAPGPCERLSDWVTRA